MRRVKLLPAYVLAHTVLLLLQSGSLALRLLYHHIPQQIISGRSTKFICDYDLEADTLYSVKWYKEDQEFYRYVPKEMPTPQIFRMTGIDIDVQSSTDKEIVLNSSNLFTSGKYRCEVSAEAPSFNTVSYVADVEVVELPESPPEITGMKEFYEAGELLQANCTSRGSYPNVSIFWYINDSEIADAHSLREFATRRDSSGRTDWSLRLTLRLKKRHFRGGVLTVKCTATVGSAYWESAQQRAYLKEFYLRSLTARAAAGEAAGPCRRPHAGGGLLVGRLLLPLLPLLVATSPQ